jgi:hypothetical protein
MAVQLQCGDETEIELGDLVAALNEESFDPGDPDSFAAAAPWLKRLANNRAFLADLAVAELKDRCTRQSLENRYSSQVIMLHRASEKFFIRANFWPSPRDTVLKASGMAPFFYHVPHDHNFSFLTVGYTGPGYWSEYYEYDYESVVGLAGEKVDLRFIEKSRLEPGKLLFYRAHRDVHNQLPADEMSVSICEVAGILTRTASEALLALAANHDGGDARDLVESFAVRHPCDRIQFAAIRELAAAADDVDEGLAALARGAGSPNRFIAEMATREIRKVEATRAWITRPTA